MGPPLRRDPVTQALVLRVFPAAALLLLFAPVLAGLAGVFLPAFGYLPVLGRTEPSLQPFRDLLALPGLGRSVALSLGTGLATTAISFALVMLFIAGWRGTRTFAALERLVAPLLSVPHAAAAFGLAFLIAPSGFFARLLSPWATGWESPPDLLIVQDRWGIAMSAGLIAKEVPFLLLMALSALPQARASEVERINAALGYGRTLGFVHGVLPPVYSQIRLAVFAVLAYSTSVVDVALILGPTTPATLAVRVLELHNDPDFDRQLVAAAGAVLQIGVTAFALLLWVGAERLFGWVARSVAASGWRAQRDWLVRVVSAASMVVAASAILGGILLLALWSVAVGWSFAQPVPARLSLDSWQRVLPSLAGPIRDTVALGAASSIVAVALTLGALEHEARSGRSRSGRALTSLFIPLLVPQVAFLFGLQILFSYFGWDGTFPAVLLAHLVFVFPYVFLSLADPWWHWDPRYGQIARTLGLGAASAFWRVRLPMLTRSVLTAAALGFAVSVALYLPTLLIGAGRWPTVTTETVALASGGNRNLVGATALLQAMLPFLGFALAAFAAAFLFRKRRLMRASA